MEQVIRVGITSTVRQVYFRAGLAIAPGKSELDVSSVQCETLEADPRLVVTRLLLEGVALAPADTPQTDRDLDAAVGGLTGSGYLAGVATLDGKVTPLAEMKVDELRELAVKAIPGAASMKKAELAAAIAATEVQYPVKDEAGVTTEPPAAPVVEGA
ncbi:hypothetical protein D3C75_475070 [compost metagenome]